jgi:hypothetical protein
MRNAIEFGFIILFAVIVAIGLFELVKSHQDRHYPPICPKGYVMVEGTDGYTETQACVPGFLAKEKP